MSISVLKLCRDTFLIRPEALLELTSTNIFLKDFDNTKRKMKAKRLRKVQDGGVSGRIAMLNFI